ncbi:MAG: Crp/Fnr family transcriptional regulator [Alphaproteobacteria bacterium]|nr:Crp/Fnr family transcriptional regulator [Rhodospirillales bacterium]MCW9044964.1 Crp/Fnr family transcriptional regulator [Alphaproteobacteria bacterium]
MPEINSQDLPDIALHALKGTALFKRLPKEQIAALFRGASVEEVSDDQVLFRQDEDADRFYLILSGRVELFVESVKHKESIIDIIGPGEYFGIAPIFEKGAFQNGAKVVEGAKLVVMPAEPFLEHLEGNFPLIKDMMASMSFHLRSLVRQVSELKLKTTGQRLGSFLLGLTDVEIGKAQVKLPYDKKLLANRLGMKPESLSRALGKLREVGVVGDHDSLILEDVETLRDFCQDSDLSQPA